MSDLLDEEPNNDDQTDLPKVPGSEGEGGGTTQPKPGTTAQPDRQAKLEEALAGLAQHVKTVTAPKPEVKQPTKEELAKHWGVFNPEEKNQKFFHEFFGLDETADPKTLETRKALFAQMQEGLVRQAIIGARHLFADELAKRDALIEELRGFHQQAQAQTIKQRFDAEYPVFADPKFSKILKLASEDLADKEFPDEAAYRKALAESAAAIVKGFDPSFDLGADQQTKPAAGNTPRLPRSSVGGTGGSGGGAGKTSAPSLGGDIDSLA